MSKVPRKLLKVLSPDETMQLLNLTSPSVVVRFSSAMSSALLLPFHSRVRATPRSKFSCLLFAGATRPSFRSSSFDAPANARRIVLDKSVHTNVE